MKRLDDSVLKVARENEATIPGEFLHEVSKGWLCGVCVKIVSLVKDNIFSSSAKRDRRGEVEDLIAKRIDVAIHAPVDDDVVAA
jgi:hypothetical protein